MIKSSRDIRQKKSINTIHRNYEYINNIPSRGLMINNLPAMTQINPSKVGDYVLLTVRDPLCDYNSDPAELLADRLDKKELIGRSGMFLTYSGYYAGAHISVVSGGSGSSEVELALYDLMEFTNASTFIRVGGSGGIGEDVAPGDLVISSGIVRDEGMTKSYIDAAYPAVCHYEVVLALVEAAELNGAKYHVGTTISVDSDFVGGGRPSVGGYIQPWNTEKAAIYDRAGVLNGDRESSAIVTLSALFGRRGGAICSVADNITTGDKFIAGSGHQEAMDIALECCGFLKKIDSQKNRASKPYWYPGLCK